MDVVREVERLQRELETRRRDDAEALELCGKITAARAEPPSLERAGKIETLLDELVKLVQTRAVLAMTMSALDAASQPLRFPLSSAPAKIREILANTQAPRDPVRVTLHDELEITLTPAKQPVPGREAPRSVSASPTPTTPLSPRETPTPTSLPPRDAEGPRKCMELDGVPGGQMGYCGRPSVLRISCETGDLTEHVDVCEKHRHAKLDRLAAQGYIVTTPSVLALLRKS